ncbi:MAG TPA: ATP-binding cassette domain-containing protein [Actinocrinis sp.]|uniref:ABC transporter ATP-binding protein n=1 Tax=Actinocrinis sp. TaxID=1920516 RepID=UPI002D36D76E|nr:ATP-binding cassette domain-containing protein [Actinocrinis sp.]HZU56825.1 ATP-binding cassette domain-containing protein [Actinocrinis sp.]
MNINRPGRSGAFGGRAAGQAEGGITAENLTKVFHVSARRPGRFSAVRSLISPQRVARTAVDGVSFQIQPGELVAFLGPNGAGKSTTIKMLTGILTPSSGRVEVNGLVPHRERIANARRVGAVFGQRSQLWWDLPARDSLSVLADIHGVGPELFRERVAAFDRILELSAFWDTRARQLSLGQRVRCDLAAALIHDPAVLYLDEPTIGMDVVVKEQVREFLRDQVENRGRTVVLTTHDMTEVERLAERVILINHGQIVYDGDLSTLRRNHSDTDEPDGNADLEDVMRRAFGRQASELLGERAESESSTRLGGTGERAGAQNADKPQAAMSS